MIKLRISAFSHEKSDIETQFIEGEVLTSTVSRVLKENNLEGKESFFQVLVNGHRVDSDFWPVTSVRKEDKILIAPIVKGGDFGQIFKTVVVIVVTVVATAYGQSWAGPVAGGLLGAAASIGTTLLLNSLIPPPNAGGFDLGGLNSFESSQMYSITSQSNSAKKFGAVPKVYGRHRIYPVIAANPYTDIEADPSTGELVQYFYCIYDLGLGPNVVEEIKIGDTPIFNFSDTTYNLVDLNRPTVSEGPWDDSVLNNFRLYKGDSEIDPTSVFINANQVDNGALEDYQIIRNTAVNSDNSPQEVILTFVNPQGLIAYATNGETVARTIELDIQFSKVGEDVWRSFNDFSYVIDARGVGGDVSNADQYLTAFPFTEGSPYTLISNTFQGSWTYRISRNEDGTRSSYTEQWGYPAGSNFIVLEDALLSVGKPVFFNGNLIGTVASISPWSSGYSRYNLSPPLPNSIVVYSRTKTISKSYGGIPYVTYKDIDMNGSNKFFRRAEGRFKITRRETGQVYSTVKFSPRETGQFKVRITRVMSYSSANYQIFDELALASVTTRFDRNTIITDKRHTFLEIRIRATNQLNGAVQNLSAVITSVLDVWDSGTSSWKKEVTSNPAWVFADLLTGQVNKRAISKSRLHIDSLVEWADFCDEIPEAPAGQDFVTPRFRTNFILDYDTTLQTILNQVSNACQASLNIIDGKYGVLLDIKRTIPVQVFTPRNSSNFSSVRNYSVRPHAVKIKYIDPNNWEIQEKVVYDDGYDYLTATEFDELTSFACTDDDQAWRFGRYMIAQNKLRQETISIDVDFEFLVCTRGDYVQITQDVMKVGGTPARVKSVGPTLANPSWPANRIVIDEGITTTPMTSYGYVARSVNGIVTNTLTVINSDTMDLDGVLPLVGDLIVIGEMGFVTIDCLVKSISPNDNLTAQLVLVEKADAVYDAESTSSIPDYDPRISRTTDVDSPPPAVTELSVLENSWLCGANSFEHYITIDWDVPVGTAFEFFEIYVNSGRGFDIVTTTRDSKYTYMVGSDRVGFLHEFKILAVSATGKKLDLSAASQTSATPERKTTRPVDIQSLGTNITGEVLQLDWEPVNDCIREYLIRYSPTLTGTWESSIPLLRTDKNTTLASVQARTGTYLIKAVDFNDNESQKATVAITTIPELLNLNIISTTTDFPDLLGSKDRVRKNGDTLILQNKVVGGVTTNEYYSEGYYYYKGFLDLGQIYTVRLQSLIQAEGYTVDDIMSNWVTLSSVAALANSRYSEWDVQTEYRTTDTFNVMSDWITLSDIDPLSEGQQDNWSEWRRFTMGDGTGRIFQFRLKLISNKASVSPRVFDGTIKADMPDRTISIDDVVVPDTGYNVLFDPPFKGPTPHPNIQVSIQNAASGDYYELSSRTVEGFNILIKNSSGTPVSRTVDIVAKGYGRKSTYIL